MQDITPILREDIRVIESYGSGGFTVSGNKVENSIFIFEDSFSEIEKDSLEKVVIDDFSNLEEIEILIVGFGEKSNSLEQELETKIKAFGVKIEYMNTGAGARTYNVLISEERKVAALLIAV